MWSMVDILKEEFSGNCTHRALESCIVVYTGFERLQDGPLRILPYDDFVQELHEGRIIPSG